MTLATGERPDRGFLFGIALVTTVLVGLANIDGPLEGRTARIGAIATASGLLGAAFWLLSWFPPTPTGPHVASRTGQTPGIFTFAIVYCD